MGNIDIYAVLFLIFVPAIFFISQESRKIYVVKKNKLSKTKEKGC